jgi:hypothetical protein
MRRVLTIVLAAALVAVVAPSMALGQSNAGIDEYTEEVPGAGGGNPTHGGGGGGEDPSTGGPLSPAEVSSLEELGADGAAAAELAQASGPRDDGGTPGVAASPDDSSGVADVVGDLAGDSDEGIGIMLPVVLALTLLAAVGFVLVRRHGGRPGAA